MKSLTMSFSLIDFLFASNATSFKRTLMLRRIPFPFLNSPAKFLFLCSSLFVHVIPFTLHESQRKAKKLTECTERVHICVLTLILISRFFVKENMKQNSVDFTHSSYDIWIVGVFEKWWLPQTNTCAVNAAFHAQFVVGFHSMIFLWMRKKRLFCS